MPIYEYTCKACDTKFEKLVRALSPKDKAQPVGCPTCGSKKTARTLSVFAVGAAAAPRSASAGAEMPVCGRCGGAAGSCQAG